jgi:ABC-2 type transport system permease protein
MQNILAIWQREIKSYFVSPIAYVVLTVYLFITGLFFFGYVAQLSTAQIGQIQQAIDVPGIVIRGLFQTTSVVLLFIVPMLTMGLFAEEKKRGTIELLLTTPVGNLQALAGKYLASLTFLLLMLVGSLITIAPLFVYSQPELKPIFSGYLGLFLCGAALLAIGIFISTLTENQIVAVIITFGVSLVLWLVEIFAPSSGPAKSVISYLSVISHLDDFVKGVIDTTHIIFYVTFAFVGLFLAYRSLESMRWKG